MIFSTAFPCPRFPAGAFAAIAVTALLGACGPAPVARGISDPHEAQNRQFHAFNRSLDRLIVRPAANTYSILPQPVENGISNFADNLEAPGDVLNNILQGRPGPAAQNTLRFAVNTVFGIGGLLDAATALGIPAKPTDFGETLYVWGMGEGNYTEVPFLGPKTERDLIGSLVDIAMNPVRLALPAPESRYATVAQVASSLGDRARYSDTVDSILYESADSYAQTRLLYLQNRRFGLGQTTGESAEDGFVDPYEDLYAD
jgi:phospholipid-binding lipoprotein MlaA